MFGQSPLNNCLSLLTELRHLKMKTCGQTSEFTARRWIDAQRHDREAQASLGRPMAWSQPITQFTYSCFEPKWCRLEPWRLTAVATYPKRSDHISASFLSNQLALECSTLGHVHHVYNCTKYPKLEIVIFTCLSHCQQAHLSQWAHQIYSDFHLYKLVSASKSHSVRFGLFWHGAVCGRSWGLNDFQIYPTCSICVMPPLSFIQPLMVPDNAF